MKTIRVLDAAVPEQAEALSSAYQRFAKSGPYAGHRWEISVDAGGPDGLWLGGDLDDVAAAEVAKDLRKLRTAFLHADPAATPMFDVLDPFDSCDGRDPNGWLVCGAGLPGVVVKSSNERDAELERRTAVLTTSGTALQRI